MLSKEDVRSQFHSALQKITHSQEVTIDDNEKFDDYGLDSLDRMNLLLEMEELCGCDLGELDLTITNTFNLLHEEIVKQISGK
jgi:acyl carrier protein